MTSPLEWTPDDQQMLDALEKKRNDHRDWAKLPVLELFDDKTMDLITVVFEDRENFSDFSPAMCLTNRLCEQAPEFIAALQEYIRRNG
jgi:hypothetical protein